jgi:enoyl-CoA hydratase
MTSTEGQMAAWDAGTFEALTISVDRHVAEVTLSRPDLLNRADAVLHEELPRAFVRLAANRDIRAVVLASTGKVFSAGGDFALMLAAHDDLITRMETHERGKRLMRSVLELPVPVIVALHGDAIGVGATLVLTCDAVIAARTARLSDPHVNIGLVAGDGGCVAWPAAAGLMRARRYLLTGDLVSAADAHQWGMVTDLVDLPEDTLPAARKLANRIAELPPLAVQGTKRSLSRLALARVYEVLDYSFAQQAITSASDDLIEAIGAFKEKRKPVYKGH